MFSENFKIIILALGILVSSGDIFSEEVGYRWRYFNAPEASNKEVLGLALEAVRKPLGYAEKINEKIFAFSEKLENYIRDWLDGKADAEFPPGFFSEWIDNKKTHDWRLVNYDKIDPQEQWYVLPAYDPSRELHQFSPDPSGTYLRVIFLAPLDSKLKIEGDFPHCRFMDYQIILPLDPLHPQEAMCEVPLVDIDIEPDPGHTNPFRVGADRNAQNRHYHVEFDLQAGNALSLNPEAMISPAYRAPGNTRTGGPFQLTSFKGGNVLVPAVLWLRYYAPDKEAGPLGGVPLPKVHLELPSGEKFWITCDKSRMVELQTSTVRRISETPPQEPYPFIGPSLGWFKMYDIMFAHMEARGYYKSEPWGKSDLGQSKKRVRRSFRLLFNRGADANPPGNYETGPTCNNYNSYLVRPMSLGEDKVIVLTGKLPRFPHTRNGELVMVDGDVRFFSITHQLGTNSEYNKGYHGIP
ncbi:MAG: hypothetical protein GF375_00370, partial [Candidatus Omnitrophica bacterium]|nr:hypothetical protein [Candidatus Omnitrophota bacterium]MBD3268627.1 hypothetical protein [Candidatus Omnitrophota bacterium]